MKAELFPFQKRALADLRMKVGEAIGGYQRTHSNQVVSFTAPTGAGKTIIMASLIENIFFGDTDYPEQPEAIIVWLSDSPQLNEQSKQKIDLKADRIRFNQCVTISEESFDQETLNDGHIYFLNTQKLGKGSNLTKRSDERQYTIWETLANTARDKSDRLYVIIDEAHRGMQGREAGRATTIMQKFLKGSPEDGLAPMPVVIGMSATSARFNALVQGTTSTTQYSVVTTDEVRASGLLKDRIVISYLEENNGNKDMAVLQAAADEWKDKWDHWYQYCYEQHYFWKEQTDLETCLHDVIIQDMEKITGMTVYESPDKLWQQAIRKEDGSSNPDAIQVISPYRGEFYGTGALNTLMQNDFNPYWSSRYNLDGISYFDKVIQFRNRPKSDMAYAYNQETRTTEQHEVFNGEIGLVLMHPFDSKNKRYKYLSTIERFQVAFSNRNRQKLRYNYGREYGKNDKGWNLPEQKPQDNLELAYAISVHKSQGSEFDYVYIVIPKRDSHLLSMELLYTAITRAQKKVTIFLQEDIGTLSSLGHIEKSAVRRINSSVFKFVPLPEELLYIQNWYADEKKLATLSEYFVRSKSEVIIANMLVQEEVPFVYEEPLFAPDGTMFLPDFTVKFRGETYYWEHVGRLDLPDYRAHWEIKEKWYEKHFPGKLLTTFEGKDLSTDAMGIIKDHK